VRWSLLLLLKYLVETHRDTLLDSLIPGLQVSRDSTR
jgi:hypothetical protein